MWKPLMLATLVLAGGAQAQTKKELVQKVLTLQQPGIEAIAQQLAEQPVAQMMQRAGMALQQMPADKREALARDIQADAKKYADDAVPLVRERAVKLAPTTIGPMLEEKFSDDELKQLIAILESPVNSKYQKLGGDFQRALTEKLIADTRDAVEPKVLAFEQSLAKRLGVAPRAATAPRPAGSGAASSKPAPGKPAASGAAPRQ